MLLVYQARLLEHGMNPRQTATRHGRIPMVVNVVVKVQVWQQQRLVPEWLDQRRRFGHVCSSQIMYAHKAHPSAL
jgi:hypothetical protein